MYSNLASASADKMIRKRFLAEDDSELAHTWNYTYIFNLTVVTIFFICFRSYDGRNKRTIPFLLPLPFQQSSASNKPSAHEEHEKAAASSIFKNLLRLSVSKANGTVPVPQELTFHEGQTIATIYTKIGEDSVHCNLIEVL